MAESKLYQATQVAGSIAAILVVLAAGMAWYMGTFSAPITSNMSRATDDIAGIRAQLNKVSDKLDAIPDQRAWNASTAATEQNRLAIVNLQDRATKDEVEWSRVGAIVDRLSDGTAAATRRSR